MGLLWLSFGACCPLFGLLCVPQRTQNKWAQGGALRLFIFALKCRSFGVFQGPLGAIWGDPGANWEDLRYRSVLVWWPLVARRLPFLGPDAFLTGRRISGRREGPFVHLFFLRNVGPLVSSRVPCCHLGGPGCQLGGPLVSLGGCVVAFGCLPASLLDLHVS